METLHRFTERELKTTPMALDALTFALNQSRGGWLQCLRAPGAEQGCAAGLASREQDTHTAQTTAMDL